MPITQPVACGQTARYAKGADSYASDALIAFSHKDDGGDASIDIAPTLLARRGVTAHAAGGGSAAIAFTNRGRDAGAVGETLRAASHGALPMVAHTLKAEGFDASEDGTGRGVPLVPTAPRSIAPALTANYGKQPDNSDMSLGPALAVSLRGRDGGATAEVGGEQSTALRASQGGGDKAHVLALYGVRRLTPTECSRLQGFPDDWNAGQSDSARYRQLGNAVAVPVVEWIARRMHTVMATEQTRCPCCPDAPVYTSLWGCRWCSRCGHPLREERRA